MSKFNEDTARYQLSKFLQSEYSAQLDIDSYDVAILTTVFDFMDSGNNEVCYAGIDKISRISRTERSTVIRRLKKLEKLSIIEKARGKYSVHIWIGNLVKMIFKHEKSRSG